MLAPPSPLRARPPRRASAGYTLVGLIVLLLVAQVMVAVALPLWTQSVKREREEELIFRGLQYAEAIRVFQLRFGRYPVRLEELIETNPRCIRKMWKDPMTEEGKWGLVFAQGIQRGAGRDGRGDAGAVGVDEGDDDDDGIDESGREVGGGSGLRPLTRRGRAREEARRRASGPRSGDALGPIAGVHSLSEDSAIKRFEGGATYKEWKFIVSLLPVEPVLDGNNVPRLYSRFVGRPFPEGLEPLEGEAPEAIPAREKKVREDAETKRERRRRERRDRRRRTDG